MYRFVFRIAINARHNFTAGDIRRGRWCEKGSGFSFETSRQNVIVRACVTTQPSGFPPFGHCTCSLRFRVLAIEFRWRLLLFLLHYTFVILPNLALVLAPDIETRNGTGALVVAQFAASQKSHSLGFRWRPTLTLGVLLSANDAAANPRRYSHQES